jgi:alpha-N-acetylglucosamine transferase
MYQKWMEIATALENHSDVSIDPATGSDKCYVAGLFGSVTQNDLWSLRVLIQSIRISGSDTPVIVLASAEEDQTQLEILESHGNVTILKVYQWDLVDSLSTTNARHKVAFHKLQAFEMIPRRLCRSKMMFLDSDMLVLNNLEALFSYPHASFSLGKSKHIQNDCASSAILFFLFCFAQLKYI